MAPWNDAWLAFLLLLHYYFCVFLLVDCRVINIYSSTKPHTILANLRQDAWTNYTFQIPQSEKQASEILSVEPRSGVVRMISRPNCKTLRHNPFIVSVLSTSISTPSVSTLRALSVYTFGENCVGKFRRKLSRHSPIGTAVLDLRDVTFGEFGLNPSSLTLRNTPARKYFMISANSDYLILRRSLRKVQERDLSLDIVFPAAKYGKDNKQTLLAQLRVFIDDKANSVKAARRIRRRVTRTAPRFSSSYLTARIGEDAGKGARVTTVQAQDTNNGNAGKLRYSMSASQNLLSQNYFKIDSSTGVITTQAALDREAMAMHYFRVKAEYDQYRSLYAEADLTIIVEDVNDNQPKFESPSYSKVIPEDFIVGDTVLEVRARDADAGSNADIRYTISNSGGANSIFRIDSSSGAITIDRELDRETVSQYTLTIEASDRGTPVKSDQTTVKITVTDVNDCVPQFSKDGYTATIREDAKPGYLVLTVSATDKDAGKNAEVVYSFSSGNDQGLFYINRLNGEIKVSKKLDYEYTSMHILFVVAQDKGEPPKYNETSVEIPLVDVNDNAPQFVNPDFQETVSEDEPVGHTFTRVQAYDYDDGTNQQIVYSLMDSNLPFGINSQTGDLFLSRKLDREKTDRYVFRIKAQDKGSPAKEGQAREAMHYFRVKAEYDQYRSLYAEADLTIIVEDVNDNQPKFELPSYSKVIPEDFIVGDTVLEVRARDADAGSNADIRYTITNSGGANSIFRIGSSSGAITIDRELDRETVSQYTLTIEASDRGTPVKSDKTRVKITVTDVNDCVPQFSKDGYTATIREDAKPGYLVLTVGATDKDAGKNAEVVYSFSSGNDQGLFYINRLNGEIKVSKKLDYEYTSMHILFVVAQDKGEPPKYNETSVEITLVDVNDNQPKFELPSYSKVIPEDFIVGDTVLEVRARDADAGSNADIRYTITNSGGANSIFRIDSSSGAITIDRELDRETVSQYTLTIEASDRGTPVKSDKTRVKITVTDVNDCVPQFSKDGYTATIREDAKPGYLVLTVGATDKDAGKNAEVVYSFSSGNDHGLFYINRLNGEIKVSKKLDYEYTSMHILFVVAQDKGEPPKYNETLVVIPLVDVNDNAPQFVNLDFQETVSEDEPVGHTFTRVQAYDYDDGTNQQIVYSLMDSNLPFGINSQTGNLFLTTKLDREKTNRYVFRIKAQDKGSPAKDGQARVTVTVGDVNDNPPKFSKSVYYGAVEEKARIGTTVVQVTAKDPDLGQSNIFYSLESRGNQRRCFRINSKGEITLSCRLNYRIAQSYTLTVKARDSRLESSATVRINVTDSNTHKPIFKERIYQVRISEATAVDGRVLSVSATDDDQGLNAKITYAIVQSIRDFKINPNTGEITVSYPLDREGAPLYRFEVSATDHGTPPLSGKTNVHISVTDVNDNKPRFLQSNYGKSIKENVPPGTKVLEVSAVDDDEGSNKAIIYSFASNGDGGGAFQIDSTQGVIRTLLPLDREKIPEYELTVIATDKGKPPMRSSVKVKVKH